MFAKQGAEEESQKRIKTGNQEMPKANFSFYNFVSLARNQNVAMICHVCMVGPLFADQRLSE